MIERYLSIRSETERRTRPLEEQDYLLQPMEDVSPAKWHLAHTTWFFETFLLKKYKSNYQPFRSEWAYLFNSYYEHQGERIARNQRGSISRPSVAEVYEYRAHVDRHMSDLLEGANDVILAHTELGLNHEQQHQELLMTDIKYSLYQNPLHPIYDQSYLEVGQQHSDWIEIESGIHTIGHQSTSEFCFDNELGAHRVFIEPCQIASNPVTQAEYLEFIAEGGYERFELWLSEGWEWVKQTGATLPQYWFRRDGELFQYTLGGVQKVDPSLVMAHVNYYEADAFARWKGCRLPTEFEWEVASDQLNSGSVWEWTHSAYLPYPGFRVVDGALGEYNGKWMVNQMVLRGKSAVTPDGHSRKTYRNFFHADKQWQFSGIRLARTTK